MNPEQLRHDLRELWLTYYRDNRHWLSRLEIWITYKGQRRPSSSFILATVSVLNPRLTQLLPLLVDLNHDPDQMVEALGLNFNPERALGSIAADPQLSSDRTVPSSSHRLPGTMAAPVEITNLHQSDPVPVPAAEEVRRPTPRQVLERPSRPIPRPAGNHSTTEVVRQANSVDSGCEGRDRPRPFPPRPRRKYMA